METDRTLGLATLKAGYENTYHGNPPIHSIVGVGRIVSFQQLYDGRSNIIVQSIGQAEMVRELSSNEPFRQIECIMRGGKLDKLGSGMGTIRSLVMQVGTLSSEACQEAQRLLEMDSLLLLDVLARKLLDTTADRLRYMAAQHVGVRMDLVRGALADLLVTEMSERASA